MRPTLTQMLKHLEELTSDGVETVRYDIDDLISSSNTDAPAHGQGAQSLSTLTWMRRLRLDDATNIVTSSPKGVLNERT
jgi:hypothetical protein